jgi:hypothetical protein
MIYETYHETKFQVTSDTVKRDFRLCFFHQTIPSTSLIHALKYFRILLRFVEKALDQ